MATATSKLARELTEVTRDGAPLDGPRPRDVLARALRSRSAALVAQAARAIARGPTPGLGDALRAAYHDLAAARAATLDAGSVAKDAVLEALDRLDDDDAALFAHAAGYVQAERARGRTVDGGARVRARGLLGLARLGHPDFLLLAGAGLGDGDPAVRLAAARALAHRGERDGAALLLLRVAAGDEVADVWTECLHGLFVLAPAFAVRAAEAARHGDDAAARERWRLALGTAPHDDAVEVLAAELAAAARGDERAPVIAALGLSLRPRARALLLELVDGDRPSDAEAALAALAIHRYDDRLVDEVRARVAGDPALEGWFVDRFGVPATRR